MGIKLYFKVRILIRHQGEEEVSFWIGASTLVYLYFCGEVVS